MDKAVLERRLHLTVTFIGGFMGCYAIFNRSDVFGSAQTGNLISFVMDLVGRTQKVLLPQPAALPHHKLPVHCLQLPVLPALHHLSDRMPAVPRQADLLHRRAAPVLPGSVRSGFPAV